ncbi:MAG TPA: LysR family transcriptional regulator [Aquabacterium sp.]|nr:LysR family transcriptional regulator [Aquabacterium sp.]HRH28223.1 LysR family transcriptional regulator [Aquabacterium sp.]
MSQAFSYRHLYYFWVVAKEGGMARAAERLGMAVQTVSAQVRELERSLGCALLKPAGRGLVLTEAGQAALRQADQIFQLGERLPEVVRESAATPGIKLAVGISDSLPKLIVRRLLQPVITETDLRLLCHEGAFEVLLADLALHRLDVVLADRVPPPNPNIKVYSHALGTSAMVWYAPTSMVAQAQADFPRSLAQVPVLLPTHHASVRSRLDHWFETQGIVPKVVGEFQDSALLATFGSAGMGVFPAAEWVEDQLISRYDVQRIGPCTGVDEHFFAIGTEKKVMHPLVQRLLPDSSRS